MRVDLIELLRCPHEHAPASLVTVAYARDGERLLDGSLGCPECHAAFTLRNGAVHLRREIPVELPHDRTSNLLHFTNAPAERDQHGDQLNHELGDRLAALLNLTEPGMRVALCGHYALAAERVEEHTAALCVAINAGATDQLFFTPTERIPLATDALRAIAIDQAHRSMLIDVARVVRVGGRVIAPVNLAVPQGCRELARDETEWVAEVTQAPSEVTRPVTLRRGSAYG